MNLTSENRTLIIALSASLVLILLVLVVLLRARKKSKNRKAATNAAIPDTSKGTNEEVVPSVSRNADEVVVPTTFLKTDEAASFSASLTNNANPLTDFMSQEKSDPSTPEFTEFFVIEDPLDGSGYLGTQINRQSSYISDFEIRALINRYEAVWLSQEVLASGFAEKGSVAGKLRTILFGDLEAIAKSTTAFHPEISHRIERADIDGVKYRLLAIDGLVYGVFLIAM